MEVDSQEVSWSMLRTVGPRAPTCSVLCLYYSSPEVIDVGLSGEHRSLESQSSLLPAGILFSDLVIVSPTADSLCGILLL